MRIAKINQLNREILQDMSSGLFGSAAEKMQDLATELQTLRGSGDPAAIRVAMNALADSAQARGYSAIPQAQAVYDAAFEVILDAGASALPHVSRHMRHSDPYVSSAFRDAFERLKASHGEASTPEIPRAARVRVEALGNREFRISQSMPPRLEGKELKSAIASLGGRSIFLEYDDTIDGPQTADRLLRETMSEYGVSFVSQVSDADTAVWIGGDGRMLFCFVIIDADEPTNYVSYACGPRELTSSIMSSLARFSGNAPWKPWWRFWH